MPDNIQNSVRVYEMIKQQLILEYELLPEDQCLLDTLDGLTDLKEVISALIRDAKRTEAMAYALKIIMKDNLERCQRFDAKAERLRALALQAMIDADITKIDAPDMTISKTPGRARIIIPDESLVPDEMCVVTRRPDKEAIREKLNSNEFVPYATLSNVVPIIKVRT